MNWQDQSPANEGQTRVWWCPAGQKHLVRLLDAMVWHPLHWVEGRSKPCLGGECEQCKTNQRIHWSAYAPAMLWTRNLDTGICFWKPIVLVLTAAAAKKLENRDCQDLLIRLSRGTAKSSIVVVEIEPFDERPSLPEAKSFDVRPILCRLWGIRERPTQTEDEPSILRLRKEA